MLNLDQILDQYPEVLRSYKENILKEYLQYKILDSVFSSKYSNKLAFLEGTALRILYGNTRFSEDLDFDNFDLSEAEFTDLGLYVKRDLELEGFKVEIDVKTKNVYRLKIRLPEILFDLGLSSLQNQKILIQVDTVPQNYDYEIEKVFLNKFDVFTQINAVPKDVLLAQKFFAAVNRKRFKGRDFFDIVFLYGIGAKPDYSYLQKNINVKNNSELKEYFLDKISKINFQDLAKDVQPFLFFSKDVDKVLKFPEFIESVL